MKWLFFIALVTLTLAGCETPTVYQQATGPQGVGYTESRIEPDRYRVTFQGGGGAPEAQVSDYVLLRAAEITLRDGYDWFRVVGGSSAMGPPRSSSSLSIGTGGGDFRRHGGFGIGTGATFDLSGGPAVTRSVEILLGKGTRPDKPDAYDARAVSHDIGPRAHP